MYPVLFELGNFRILAYWVLVAAGGVAASLFWWAKRERMGLGTEQHFYLLINTVIFGAFIGGRILYLLVYLPADASFWQAAFAWSGGFSILGALLGILLGAAFFCRGQGIPFSPLCDYLFQMAPLAHSFGRLGCFSSGCCYGRPTDLPWGVRFPPSRHPEAFAGQALHPTQLYEVAGNILIGAALYFLTLRRIEAGKLKPGTLAAAYFACYGLMRLITEGFRGHTVSLGLGLTAAQAVSLGYVAGAAGVLALLYRGER